MNRKNKQKILDADLDEDVNEFEPSDSEADYSENEKLLLDKIKKRNAVSDEDSEDEVYGFGESDSDENEDVEDMESDIDGAGDDDLPDVRAWGHKKKTFYNTDYVDQDYGGLQEKETEAAELEEQEALEIQKRLAGQLDEADFSLDIFSTSKTTENDSQKKKSLEEFDEHVSVDLSRMSKRQKIALLEKESPEFFGLIDDFKVRMSELKNNLEPVMKLIKSQDIPHTLASSFIITLYQLTLNYLTNIAFYLLLKSKRVPVASHPVSGRLVKYHHLLAQLDPIYKEIVAPQLQEVLSTNWVEVCKDKPESLPVRKRKLLKILSVAKESGEYPNHTSNTNEPSCKKSSKADDVSIQTILANGMKDTSDEDEAEQKEFSSPENAENEAEEEQPEDGRRAITYQIAKNKGLTPHRKKEQRNPRVKHRKKFEKARIRRKGQVREPRREITKYGGEVSGIKIGITKSIKLKV